MASKTWIVGTPEQARDTLLEMQAELGLEALVIFPHLPGMQRPETLEQLGRFWAEVWPSLTASASTSPPRRWQVTRRRRGRPQRSVGENRGQHSARGSRTSASENSRPDEV
jgi:hypothetical protein